MIANNGAMVARVGPTPTYPITLFQLGEAPVTIADPAYFSNIGNNPGISSDGNVVTFTATITNAASAASLNAANAASIAAARRSIRISPCTSIRSHPVRVCLRASLLIPLPPVSRTVL